MLTDPNTNAFYILADTLKRITEHPDKLKLDAALCAATERESATTARLHILSLFDDALNITTLMKVSEERTAANISFVANQKDAFILGCSRPHVDEFRNHMRTRSSIDMLYTLGDAASGSTLNAGARIDRQDLITQTNDLIKFVQSAGWHDAESKALHLQLEAFRRTIQECEYLSDDEVRQRIKSIYADFCAEFDRAFPPGEELRKAVLKWAMNTGAAGVLALGLTADAASVAGYLEDHSADYLISNGADESRSQDGEPPSSH